LGLQADDAGHSGLEETESHARVTLSEAKGA